MACAIPAKVKLNWKEEQPDYLKVVSHPIRFDRFRHHPGFSGIDGSWLILNN
jgi:hypothetical protein